jgi:hypothetical protein
MWLLNSVAVDLTQHRYDPLSLTRVHWIYSRALTVSFPSAPYTNTERAEFKEHDTGLLAAAGPGSSYTHLGVQHAIPNEHLAAERVGRQTSLRSAYLRVHCTRRAALELALQGGAACS